MADHVDEVIEVIDLTADATDDSVGYSAKQYPPPGPGEPTLIEQSDTDTDLAEALSASISTRTPASHEETTEIVYALRYGGTARASRSLHATPEDAQASAQREFETWDEFRDDPDTEPIADEITWRIGRISERSFIPTRRLRGDYGDSGFFYIEPQAVMRCHTPEPTRPRRTPPSGKEARTVEEINAEINRILGTDPAHWHVARGLAEYGYTLIAPDGGRLAPVPMHPPAQHAERSVQNGTAATGGDR